jgi:hypothetical protein
MSAHKYLQAAFVIAISAGLAVAVSTSASANVGGVRPSSTQSSGIAPSMTTGFGGDGLLMAYVANNSSDHILVTTSTNGTTWTPDVNTGLQTAMAPSVTDAWGAATGPYFVMAYVALDDDNDLFVSTSSNGTTWTSPVWTGQESKTAPAIIDNGDGYDVIAFVANNNSNDLVTVGSSNDTSWSSDYLVGGQASKTAPAMSFDGVTNNGPVYVITYVANNGSNDLLATSTTQTPPDATWSSSALVGGQQSKSAPALTDVLDGYCFDGPNDHLVLTYVANNSSNHLLVTTSSNGTNWSSGSEVGDGQNSATAAAMAPLWNVSCGFEYYEMTYVANNSNHHLLATTSTNGKTWTSDTKVDNGGNESPALEEGGRSRKDCRMDSCGLRRSYPS